MKKKKDNTILQDNYMMIVISSIIVGLMLLMGIIWINKGTYSMQEITNGLTISCPKVASPKEEIECKIYAKVKDNKITDTIELKDKEVKSTNHNNQRVFLIYSSYVIEISADEPQKEVGKIPDNVTFEAIKLNKMYVRVDEGTIKQISLNLKDIEYDSQAIVDGQEKTYTTTNNNTTNTKTEEKKVEEKQEEVKNNTYTVPNVIGNKYSASYGEFTLVKTEVDSDKPAGTIISQSPSAGSVTTDKTIYVNVSSGS